MKVDSEAIRLLAKLLEETGLTEIEVAEGEKMIRVGKGGVVIGGHGASGFSHQVASASDVMPSDPALRQVANSAPPAATAANHPGAITSPMVGTVYMRPDPNSSEFISKGSVVKAGDTLLIIEAMKVMNPIKAQKGGTVTQILVSNAQPVEFGEVLLVIE
jgi:acetyl-CoA carboxylase biotin carboxyl carrier protein